MKDNSNLKPQVSRREVNSKDTTQLPSYGRLKTAQRELANAILGETTNPNRDAALEAMCEPIWEEILSSACAIVLERRQWTQEGFTERINEIPRHHLIIAKTFIQITTLDADECRIVRRALVPQIVEFMCALCACSVELGGTDETQEAIDRTLRNCVVFEQEHANN